VVAQAWTENESKFRELVLYVAEKCADDLSFGATKLNKILFYADFRAYAILGRPITGAEYQKLEYGPAPRRLIPIRDRMVKAGELATQEIRLPSGISQKRPVNLRLPDLSLFTAEEISIVDDVIRELRGQGAETVSTRSHEMVGWIVAKLGETIPYETVFVSNEPLSQEEIARGRELAQRFRV
jgi:hypothetical protein